MGSVNRMLWAAVGAAALAAVLTAAPARAWTIETARVGSTWVMTQSGGGALTKVSATAASAFTLVNPAARAAVVVGSLIVGLELADSLGNMLRVVPRNNAPAPPGWSTWDGPPNTGPSRLYWGRNSSEDWGTSSSAAIQGLCGAGSQWHYVDNEATQARGQCDSGPYTGVVTSWVYQYTGCYAGYTMQSGVCVLTIPANADWPNDGIPTYRRNVAGTGWEQHPRDADVGGSPFNTGSPTGLTRDGMDQFGNRARETISTGSQGTNVTQQTEVPGSDGNTQVVNNNWTFNDNGQVTDSSTTSATNTTITNYSPPASTAPVNVAFPDDYAREQTLTSTNSKLDQLHEDLTIDPGTEFPVPEGFTYPEVDDTSWSLTEPWEAFWAWVGTLFPFSLLHSPLAAFEGPDAPPPVCYTVLGNEQCHDISMWDELFMLVRSAVGVLFLFGAFLLFLDIARRV